MNKSNIIIMLLLANLIATVWYGNQYSGGESLQKPFEKASEHQLPDSITNDVKADILQSFATNFNSQDYDGLYNMFGPAARSQLSKEKMEVEFAKMTKFFFSVEDGSFTHAEFSEQQGSVVVYVLHYSVTLSPKSEFGQVGKLEVTVAIEGNDYQIYGMYLHGNTSA